MSQEVMNELVNMSKEIIKLKDQKRELLEALKRLLNADHDEYLTQQGLRNLAKAAIAKAEGEKA